MSSERWRYAGAAVRGTSHYERERSCEDRFQAERITGHPASPILLAASDGAGSASHAKVGAERAICTFVEVLKDHLGAGHSIREFTRRSARDWIIYLQDDLYRRAGGAGLSPSDFAATFLGAVVDRDSFVLIQIGDGAVIVEWEGVYRLPFFPQSGRYANETTFVTSPNASEDFNFLAGEGTLHEVALLTDGLQSLAISYREMVPFVPFFEPLFRLLRRQPPGEARGFQSLLESFLNSSRVNKQTDDDKTLVLATRMIPLMRDPKAITTQ